MIPLPSPPTDSLYKFVAVAGLLLLGIGIVSPFMIEQQTFDSQNRRILETENRVRDFVLRTHELAQKDNLQGEQRARDIENIHRDLAEVAAKDKANLRAEFQEQNDLDKTRISHFNHVAWLGGALMVIGFILWWFKVQRLQDKLLRLELNRAMDESKEPTSHPSPRPHATKAGKK